MTNPDPTVGATPKSCARCGSAFGCGRQQASCWCSALPPLDREQIADDKDCLCPACLREAIARADATANRERH